MRVRPAELHQLDAAVLVPLVRQIPSLLTAVGGPAHATCLVDALRLFVDHMNDSVHDAVRVPGRGSTRRACSRQLTRFEHCPHARG